MLHFAEEDLVSGQAGRRATALRWIRGDRRDRVDLPAQRLVLNTTTGAISGTPTVAVPEGQNVTLRITSNGVTIDMVVLLRIAEPAMVSVGEFGSSYPPLNKASHMVTTEDGRRHCPGTTWTDGEGERIQYSSTDLVLTGYRPNGSPSSIGLQHPELRFDPAAGPCP